MEENQLKKHIEKNYVSKQVIRDKINEYRERRIRLANGHFWEREENYIEDNILYIACETLKELLGEETSSI